MNILLQQINDILKARGAIVRDINITSWSGDDYSEYTIIFYYRDKGIKYDARKEDRTERNVTNDRSLLENKSIRLIEDKNGKEIS